VIDIVRFRDGQLVEHWNVVDVLGLMQQLGALPVEIGTVVHCVPFR
jgi:hypothetical protein